MLLFLSLLTIYCFFFWRKLSHELTSTTNPPLFAEEDWPWANIRAHLPLYACHSVAWQAVHRSAPGMRTSKPWATKGERTNLTAVPLGRPPVYHVFDIPTIFSQKFKTLLLPSYFTIKKLNGRKEVNVYWISLIWQAIWLEFSHTLFNFVVKTLLGAY